MIRQVSKVLLAAAITAGWCQAQNIVASVDLESDTLSNGSPGSSYGAHTGTPSFWNTVNFKDADGGNVSLLDPLGEPAGIFLNLFQQASGTSQLTAPGFTGDDAALLTDGWSSTDVPGLISITGLDAGDYGVTVFGLIGSGSGMNAAAGNLNDISFAVGGFDWQGKFVEGESHHTSLVSLGAGDSIEIGWSAANFGGIGTITGIQITTVPEPPAATYVLVGVSLFGSLLLHRRKAAMPDRTG